MKSTSDCLDLIERLNIRIDDIEKLLQLLLINNLLDDAESVIKTSESSIDSDVSKTILKYGLEPEGFKNINDVEVFIIGVPDKTKITINDLIQICSVVKSVYPKTEPLFMYKTINGMQRKRILQENISFSVKGRELHVTSLGEKK